MSTLQIELDAPTERRLQELSQQEGHSVSQVATQLLARAVRPLSFLPSSEVTEAELLLKINEGWSEERWERYQALSEKCRQETLTPTEYPELVALTHEREKAHARRMEYLVQLAQLRQTSLPAVMEQLGLSSPGYI